MPSDPSLPAMIQAVCGRLYVVLFVDGGVVVILAEAPLFWKLSSWLPPFLRHVMVIRTFADF